MLGRIETFVRRARRFFSRTELVIKLFQWRRDASRQTPESTKPTQLDKYRSGLILIQIDGLGYHEIQRALASGEMPFLAKLLSSEHYTLRHLYSGLPSSTPSVQGELFYGVKTAVPAFAFIDQKSDTVYRMYDPKSALAIERELVRSGNTPLLSGGSAYCDIYTGGACESHFCAASLGWSDILTGIRPLVWLGVVILYLPMLLRTAVLVVLEFVWAVMDMFRGWFSGFDVKAEFKFVPARVAISVLMRDMITIGAKLDIARSLPIIHMNYLGYDEQAHRRGPGSVFAHLALKGIDKRIGALWSASHQSKGRHYDLWVYSDHGQESTRQYKQLSGIDIVDAVRVGLASHYSDLTVDVQSLSERIDQRRTNLFGGRYFQKLFPSDLCSDTKFGTGGITVVAMGPVGHVYLDEVTKEHCSLDVLARSLVEFSKLPAVLYIEDQQVVARCAQGLLTLPAEAMSLLGASHPHAHAATDDLIALVRHPNAGQLVLLGWVAGTQPLSFPRENGAHAGVGPLETGAFSLVPSEYLSIGDDTGVLRPLHLREAALQLLERHEDKNNPVNSPHRVQREPGSLRVMSYNVHSCIGMDGRIAPERIARIVSRYKPDVVALQELDLGRARTAGIDQAQLIARMVSMDYAFHPVMQVESEEYGDAIFTHLPVIRCKTGTLPTLAARPNLEPRGVLWMAIDVDGTEVQVFNTHLGLFSTEQIAQINALKSDQWLQHPDCTGPTILCGDMNASPRSVAMKLLYEDMQDSQQLYGKRTRKNTFSGRLPTLCIDHVLIRDVYRVTDVQVPSTELTRLASDHLPLIVDLQLPVE